MGNLTEQEGFKPRGMPDLRRSLPPTFSMDSGELVEHHNRKAGAAVKVLLWAGGVFAGVSIVIWGCDEIQTQARDNFQSRGYERDAKWGSVIRPLERQDFVTDSFGGEERVEVRKLVNNLENDVVGITRPGCLVSTIKVLGPEYPVDGGDEDNLPLIEGKYRPWYYLEVQADVYDEKRGTFSPLTDNEGKLVMIKGFVRGTSLRPQRDGEEFGNCPS